MDSRKGGLAPFSPIFMSFVALFTIIMVFLGVFLVQSATEQKLALVVDNNRERLEANIMHYQILNKKEVRDEIAQLQTEEYSFAPIARSAGSVTMDQMNYNFTVEEGDKKVWWQEQRYNGDFRYLSYYYAASPALKPVRTKFWAPKIR